MPKPPREREPLGIGCYIEDLEEPVTPARRAQSQQPVDDTQSEPGGSEIPGKTSDDANSS